MSQRRAPSMSGGGCEGEGCEQESEKNCQQEDGAVL
jgi:hypothetical protein